MTTGSGRLFYGWYVAGACLLIYFFTNGMTIFVPQNLFPRFMETFDATAGQVSITTGVMFGITAILAPFAGVLIDRYGPIVVVRTGLIIMAVCFSAYPFAQSLMHLYLLHSVLALGLCMGGLVVNVVILSNWFVTRRGAIVGLLVAMSSISGLVLPNAISPLVNDPAYGWRWGFGTLAVAFWVLAIIPGFIVLKAKPADVGQFPDGAAGPPATDEPVPATELPGLTFSAAIRTHTLWALAIGSACLWFTFQAINSQVSIFLEQEAGLTPQHATRLYSTIFGCSIAGKFVFGAISDRFLKRNVLLAASIVLLAACLMVFESGEGTYGLTRADRRLFWFTVIFGLGYGGCFTMIQLVAVESFGPRALGKILGFIICIDSAGGMLGTVLTGQLRTSSGSYLLPFSIVAVVALIAVINVLLIRPSAHAQDAD
jgi:MFS family permease